MKKKKNNLQGKIEEFYKKLIKTFNLIKKTIKSMKKIWIITLFIGICCSCNVTRTTTTKSEYYQKGDTAITIQTKTTETYNAEKKLY